VRSGRTVAHEFMQIREGAGAQVFVAMPSAKPSASFRALRVEPRRVEIPMRREACPSGPAR